MAADGLRDLRIDYDKAVLLESDMADNPLEQFRAWLQAAVGEPGIPEANAMTLATAGSAGAVSARTVLLKDVDARGFVFYTNHTSRKAADIAENPQVALVFPWVVLHRQVTVRGIAQQVPAEEAEQYFNSRPLGSRLGAWASRQSQTVSRDELDERYAELAARFGDEVPLPEFWGGYVVRPSSIEFWQGRTSRLHDRLVYEAETGTSLDSQEWTLRRLSP
jgi:pyridoxamine 5'-phosphate oxidase